MSNLPGNHFAELIEPLAGQHAEVATALALAYEQRTANLIAYWDAMSSGEEPWADTPFQRELDAIHRDIRVRLGRTAEVPK